MKVTFAGFGLTVGILTYAISTNSVNAQVIPDGTLNTTVSSLNGEDFTITDGQRVGNNLFHATNLRCPELSHWQCWSFSLEYLTFTSERSRHYCG